MSINKGIFGAESSFDDRFIGDYTKLQELAAHWKAIDIKIVLTSGSWDMIHEGHALYLEKAREYGDLLIVGVDSDDKIRKRKGPDRPIVPQQERLRMLTHLRAVDVVTLKNVEEQKWALIKAIRPDVLVATGETYTDQEIDQLQQLYCKEVIVHQPMATTSTSARLRLVQMGLATKLATKLAEKLPGIINDLITGTVTPESVKKMSKKIAIAYIPVIHQGYRQFLEFNPEYHTLYILGEDTLQKFRALKKDIRALKPSHIKQSLIVWNLLETIEVIDLEQLKTLNSQDYDILMPDEDVCRELAKDYLDKASVTFYPIFLRWDRQRSNAKDPIDPDVTLSTDQLDTELIHAAQEEAFKSSDIWRRVGALIARDGHIISKSYNQAMPHSHASWMSGDPRNNYNKGVGIEMSTFMHAEAQLIAEAAKKGIQLAGTHMYVTTFPCPPCAMLIANAGIKRLFFADGYAVLDGKNVLESKRVQLIKVETKLQSDNPAVFVPYPEA